MKNLTKTYLDQLTYEVIGAAIKVHKTLGPGLLESVYHECMKIELEDRGIPFRSEYKTTLHYNGREVVVELRCDLFVAGILVVEMKCVKALLPIHSAQTLSYMKLLNVPKGILLNFQCQNLYHEGRQTFVNELYATLPA